MEITARELSDATLEQLRAHPSVAAVDLENSRMVVQLAGAADVAPLVELLVDGGARIEEVRRGRASLEEVFLTLMEEEGEG